MHCTSNIIKLNIIKWAQKRYLGWISDWWFTNPSFFSSKHFFIQTYDMIILTWHLFAQWGMQKFDGCFICFRWHWILQPYFYIAQGLLLHIFAQRKNLIFLFIHQSNMIPNILYENRFFLSENHYHLYAWNQMKIIVLFVITKNNQTNNVHLLSQFLIIDENVLP